MIVYDTHFNLNEWFNVILFTAGYGFLFLTHRRFPPKHTLVYVLYGIAAVTLFDHTLSVAPFDFYDVNDTSRFQWMDFLNYLGFGPISYLYVFLFERFLGGKLRLAAFYILAWSLIGVAMEILGLSIGLYHHKNGYTPAYSFSIYLATQSVCLLLFYYLQNDRRKTDKSPNAL